MSPLFGNKDEKAAQEAAAKAEVDRLAALPVPDLAAELIPALGPDGPTTLGWGHVVNWMRAATWLMSSYPRGSKFVRDLQAPVREGLQALEHAGLIEQRSAPEEGHPSWARRASARQPSPRARCVSI